MTSNNNIDMDGRCIIETIQLGKQLKITAIDPISGREVSMIGALGTPTDQLHQIAVRKLRYVLNRDQKK